MNKSYIFLIIFQLSIQFGYSQVRLPSWEHINFSDNPIHCNEDSTNILVTNRVFNPKAEGGSFFGDEITSERKLYYAVNTCWNGTWTVFLQPSLDSALKYISKDRNFVAYVHGDGKSYPRTLSRSAAISSIYHVNIIAFDYPSLLPEVSGLTNFYNSRKNIKNSTVDFARYLAELRYSASMDKSPMADKKLTIFFHSLGGYLYRKYLTDNDIEKEKGDWVDNIVLNAPATKQARHRHWLQESNFQKRLYVTSNKHDFTLKGAMLITFSKQMGGNIRKPLAKNGIYINFTPVAGYFHNCFLEKTLLETPHYLYYFYREVLNGKELDLSDEDKFVKRKDGLGYDVK